MHSYEKTIVDIKTEYTDFLLHIISPLIYEGFKTIYTTSINEDQEIK